MLLRRPLLLLVSLAPLPAALVAAPMTAESRITAATIYSHGAIVVREAELELPVGTQEVLFRELPGTIDPDRLQVSGSGAAHTTILDVRAAPEQLEAPANARLEQLQEQLRTAQSQLREISDRASVLQQQRDYLEKIKLATVQPPNREGASLPTVSEWSQLLAFYADALGRTLTGLQETDRQRADAQARVETVQREIDQLRASTHRAVTNVTVRLDVTTAGTLHLKLTYPVAQAAWSPTYDVRVTSADKSIELGYGAVVTQSSGEDWTGVQLVLSTARPDVAGTPPELQPWRLSPTVPEPPIPLSRFEARQKALEAPAAADQAAAVTAGLPEAVVTTGLTSATFTLPHPADIPADNEPHKVAITTQPLQGRLTHLTIPKLAELVYLQAEVTNSSEFPLVAGNVKLFLDGNYVSESRLKTVMPGEKFTLDLGVDDGIPVKRRLVNRVTEETGIISRREKITYDVRISLENNRPNPTTVIVKDQVPISQHEKILVTYETPGVRDVTKADDGTLTWKVDLPPGQKRELTLRIAVEHPADLPVSGLE